MVAMAKKAWFALMNWKTRMGSLRSPVRPRPLPLPRCRAPGAVADSHAADGSAPRARRWSGRPVGGHHRDRPVVPKSKSPGQSVRTRATAPPVFAQIGPDQPSVAGIPAHRVGDSSALMAPPSQVERCPPNRVNSTPVEWSPCRPRTIQLPLTASPCGRLSRSRSTISQSDFHPIISPFSPHRLGRSYKLALEPDGSPLFPLTPLVACWRYEPREHPRPLALARLEIPPSPLSGRVGYSDHGRFRGS